MTTFFKDQAHYRKIFIEVNGDGPYVCFFCSDEVSREEKDTRLRLCIHHKNHDHDDNCKSNLKPSHWWCHSTHHTTGKVFSDERCEKISAAAIGRVFSDGTREKISAASKGNQYGKGHVHSLESRRKMSASQTGKTKSPEHRAKIGAAHIGQGRVGPEHHTDETKAKIGAAHLGSRRSPEQRAKMSESAKHRWAQQRMVS